MIHLLHGADTVSSRNFLLRLKEKFKQPVLLNARRLSREQLFEALAQEALFAADVIIVDWFEEKFLPVEVVASKEMVFWSAQTFSKTSWADRVTNFPARAVSIFKMVDAFGLRRINLAQEYLERTMNEKTPPEVILAMLTRQLKLVSLSLAGEQAAISKSDFIREKVVDQAKLWNEKTLKKAFRALLEADLAIKSGLEPKLALNLSLSKI